MRKKSIDRQMDELRKELQDLGRMIEALDDCYNAVVFSPKRKANVTAAALRIATVLDKANVDGSYWKDLQLLEKYAFNPFANDDEI